MRNSARAWWPGFLLGAGTVGLVAALWLGLGGPPSALGQIPDSGAQRADMIKELRDSNRKLAEMADLLRDIRDDARKERGGKTGDKRP
jgi:hypothetical protein